MNIEQQQDALKALYDTLLEHETPYLESLKGDALRAREGIATGIVLKSKNARGETTDFDLRIPKHAITLMCARTGGGKTTTMCDLAVRMVERGATGFYITLEEPAHAINAKLMASYSAKKNPNHSMMAATVRDGVDSIAGVKVHPDFDGFKTDVLRGVRVIDGNKSVDLNHVETPSIMYQPQYVADLIAVRNAQSKKPLDFVVIDFGQLMETMDADNSQSYQRIKAVMQAMKNLCGQLGLGVIMGAQMQRSCHAVSIWDWEPEMIRDGSDMEQAASLIMAIGRDKEYPDKEHDMVMRFLKNRNGPQRVAGMFAIDYARCNVPSIGLEPTNDD